MVSESSLSPYSFQTSDLFFTGIFLREGDFGGDIYALSDFSVVMKILLDPVWLDNADPYLLSLISKSTGGTGISDIVVDLGYSIILWVNVCLSNTRPIKTMRTIFQIILDYIFLIYVVQNKMCQGVT